MRNLRSGFVLIALVGALTVPFLATGQPAGQRRIQVDSAPVPSPDFQDGGDVDFTATGSVITGAVKSGVIGRTEIDENLLSIQMSADCSLVTCDLASDGELCYQADGNQRLYVCDGQGTPAWEATGGAWGIDADNSSPRAVLSTEEVNIYGGAGIATSVAAPQDVTVSTASGETNFLASGALTCGASTQGKMQVHTTPLQYCDNAATPTLKYAAYGNATGAATSASVADAGSDTTTWVLLAGTSATGDNAPLTDSGLTFDASTNLLAASTFQGGLSGGSNSVVTTPAASDNDTSIASTAFTHAAIDALDGNGITCTSGGTQTCSVDADIRTEARSFNIENLQTTTDDYKFNIEIPNASTITQVTCSTSANTVTIKLDERSAPGSAGTQILGSTSGCSGTNEIACSTTKNTCTAFNNAGIAAGNVIAIAASADTLGTADVVRVHVTYTIDD